MPRFDPAVWELPKDDPERRKAKRQLKYAHGAQKKAEKLAKNPYRVLKQAARFLNVPRIYFSLFFDSRLRIYTHAMGLTYQGSDYQKALLQFADGLTLTDKNKKQVEGELLVSIANCWGNDKLPFKERIEWAREHIKNLSYVAEEPLSTAAYSVWTAADEPFQFLALLREYFELFVWHTKTVTQVPGGRDATNSGSQILGGMCRDAKTCFYTNVVLDFNGQKSDTVQDLYGVVAKGAQAYLRNDVWVSTNLAKYRKQALAKAEKNGYDINADFVLNIDPAIVNRSHLKRLCMVDSYGGSWSSKNEYVSETLAETALDLDIKISLAEKRLVTDAGIAAQANEFPLSTELNKWFKHVGKSAIAAGLELIQWDTPDGSHIVQEYRVPNYVQVTTYAMGGGTYWQPLESDKATRGKRSSATVRDGYKDEILEGKTQTALGANYTHSHDSCIIRYAFNTIDTPYFGIHDCIYAPHGGLEKACKHMRYGYYQTVKGDCLEGLVKANGLECNAPPKGDADISECIDAPYMFS
jgi:DNA-directed RNA polymerase